MVNSERKGVLVSGSKSLSLDITKRMLINTRDWMYAIGELLSTSKQTIHASINIFDAYVYREKALSKSKLQAVACASMTLSAKYNQVESKVIYYYAQETNGAVTERDIIEFEERIFTKLGCTINVPIDTNYLKLMNVFSNNPEGCDVVLLLLSINPVDFLPSVVVTTVKALIEDEDEYDNPFNVGPDGLTECTNAIIDSLLEIKFTKLTYANLFVTHKKLLDDIINREKYPKSTASAERYTKSYYFVEYLNIQLIDSTNMNGPALGRGTYGSVKKVNYKGKYYALKTIHSDPSDGLGISFLREVSICMTLNHPNIVKPVHINTRLNGMFLDVATSDLKKWSNNRNITEDLQHILAFQMFFALSYMEKAGCLHRDIKPQNILVYEYNELTFMLADFGIGRGTDISIKDNTFTAGVVTLPYRSPELLLGKAKYNFTIDVWSVGCTLYEFAVGKVLFEGWTDIDQIMKIFNIMGSPTLQTWSEAFNLPEYDTSFSGKPGIPHVFENPLLCPMYSTLLPMCLIINPANRPTSTSLYYDTVLPVFS
jgi:hypothetical protein